MEEAEAPLDDADPDADAVVVVVVVLVVVTEDELPKPNGNRQIKENERYIRFCNSGRTNCGG